MVTRHQYGISALVTQTSFCEGSSFDLETSAVFSLRVRTKKDVSPACFARLVKAYYQSVYHVTFSFVAFASGEFFEAMEIVDGNCVPFSTADLLYVHCIDSNVQFEYSFSRVASLNLISVLGHVSFPSDLRSRGLVLFLYTKEIRDCLENKRSPKVTVTRTAAFLQFLMWS